jgi:hypothetical protein
MSLKPDKEYSSPNPRPHQFHRQPDNRTDRVIAGTGLNIDDAISDRRLLSTQAHVGSEDCEHQNDVQHCDER